MCAIEVRALSSLLKLPGKYTLNLCALCCPATTPPPLSAPGFCIWAKLRGLRARAVGQANAALVPRICALLFRRTLVQQFSLFRVRGAFRTGRFCQPPHGKETVLSTLPLLLHPLLFLFRSFALIILDVSLLPGF
jgi:hypothetical protein